MVSTGTQKPITAVKYIKYPWEEKIEWVMFAVFVEDNTVVRVGGECRQVGFVQRV